MFLSRAIISVLKELIHLIHGLQRKECRMLFLDYQDRRPIYEQIVEKFRRLILSGAMEPSSKMPSVRQLAMELSINPNTIQRAYRQLEMEGWIATVPGKGCFVCSCPISDPQEEVRVLNSFEENVRKLLAMGYTRQELAQKIMEDEPCSK